MRFMPFVKGKKGFQMAGGGVSDSGGGGGGYELPIASAGTLGGVKIGSGLSITSSGVLSSSGGHNYSSTEVDTGIKWIDGKTIYQKTITSRATTSNTSIDLSTLSIDLIIKLEAVKVADVGNNMVWLNYYASNEDWFQFYYKQTDGDHSLVCKAVGENFVGNIYVTIYYTKTS